MNSDFRDLLSAFNRYRVRYLVVGAYAVMRYTEPRYTKDLDVWVDSARANAGQVVKALVKFGAPLKGHDLEKLVEPYTWFQIGVPPNRIDILTTIDAVRFSTAWEKRNTTRVNGIKVHFISCQDLMRNKRAAGRPLDLVDLDNLMGKT